VKISTQRIGNANSIQLLTFLRHLCFVIFIMAWRLHEHVLRGTIDNRTRGRVIGEIWLAGIDQPLMLELTGDCAPDLAGCELSFENPNPIPMTTKPPAPKQRGPADNITAARKMRVFDVPIEEAIAMSRRGETPPENMANAMYLEWFSERSRRVMIESADYRLQISGAAWRYTREEIAERQRRIAEEETPFAIAITQDGETQEWDEVRYEQFLRESDALTERYGRLLEKYADHHDSERIIAREMAWAWLEEALDRQDEEKRIAKRRKLRIWKRRSTKKRKMSLRTSSKTTSCRRPIRSAKELIGCAMSAATFCIPSRSALMMRCMAYSMS
jgi:hypothetical protein